MDRRKIIDEAISTQQMMEEIDWDKLLWIPGEKKIFLPAIKEVRLHFNWDWDKHIGAMVKEAQEAQRRIQQRNQVYEGMCDECMGEDTYRREYLGVRRQQEQRIVESNPMRIPLRIRAGHFRNFDWGF